MIELFGALIALAGTAIVSYTDWKTGYMPDKYTHAMIVAGIALLPLYSGFSSALADYFIAFLVFGVSFLFYIFGQLGGGDVKLFTALALLLPRYPHAFALLGFGPVAAPYPFVISVFFTSAVFAMFFVSLNYLARLSKDKQKIKQFNHKLVKGCAYAAVTLPLAVIWSYFSAKMLVIALPMAIGAFVLAFKEDILRLYVAEKKKVKDLNDDDVLALELMSASTKKKLGITNRKTFLTEELRGIKKHARENGITEVIVSEYLPKFGPYILVSLLLNLAVGDTLLWLLFV